MCCLLQDLAGRQRRLGDAERQFRSGAKDWIHGDPLDDTAALYKDIGAFFKQENLYTASVTVLMRYIKVEVQPHSMHLRREAVWKSPNLVGLWNTTQRTLCNSEIPSEPQAISNHNLILEALNQIIGWLNGCSNIKRTLTIFLTDQSTPKTDLVNFVSADVGCPSPWKVTQLRHLFRGSQWAAPCRWLLICSPLAYTVWSAVPTDRQIRWKRRHPWKAPSEVASWAFKMAQCMWRHGHFSRECPPKCPLCQEYESWWNIRRKFK